MSVKTAGELINLSMNIRRLRHLKGWSVRELGKRAKITHANIVHYEQPICNMTLDTLEKLADAFGVSMSDLLTPKPDKEKA